MKTKTVQELIEVTERLLRIASVELKTSRPDVLKETALAIRKAKTEMANDYNETLKT